MTDPRYLLDTDHASYFLRGRHEFRERFRQVGYGALRLSRVTVAELRVLTHMRPSSRISAEAIAHLAGALGVLEPSPTTWDRFAEIKARVLATGGPPGRGGDLDILQASVAIEHGVALLTHNRQHFEPLTRWSNLRIEDWVPA